MLKAIGGLVSKVGQGLGLVADPNAGSAQMAASLEMQREALKAIQNLDLPDIEKQKLALQVPELVGLLEQQDLGPSEAGMVKADPTLVQAQRRALAELQSRSVGGMTAEDMAQARDMQRSVGASEQARQASIIQNMQERGAGGAGSELAARLLSSQASADRASQSGDRMAVASADARRQAMEQMGSLAGRLREQDVGEQERAAGARDLINRYNMENRKGVEAANLASKQKYADVGVETRNREQEFNKGLIQQDFENRYKKAGGTATQFGNLAGSFASAGNAAAQGAANQAAGMRDLAKSGASLAMAGGGGGGAQDAANQAAMAKKASAYADENWNYGE